MIMIEGENLGISDVIAVANGNNQIEISSTAKQKIRKSNDRLQKILQSEKPVYGISTGYGIFADKHINLTDSRKLNRNLILSHAVGVGEPLPERVVRAAMLIRANTLAKGYSGVRLEVVETLIEMLRKNVIPIIPSQGSLGSSGDLCQLSQLCLVLTRDENDKPEESGSAIFNGSLMTGKAAMDKAGIQRIVLGPKEGLALNNGATFSAAIAALCVHESQYLVDLADLSIALSLEALLGCGDAFDPRIHAVRAHTGQAKSAARIIGNVKGSNLVGSTGRVQDAYSLRCAPQVHGAVRDSITHVCKIVETEINSATDNPLIFENGDVKSGGNFHGEPIGLAMDYLGMAMAELGAISERRTYRLTDQNLNNGLPAMLVDLESQPGLNSGVMMPQYTAASLVLENQTLAAPDSVHSLPTSAAQEDHNANAMTAARHAFQIIENVKLVLAIELFTSTRALDLRLYMIPNVKLGKETAKAFRKIRERVPYVGCDSYWKSDIDEISNMIKNHEL